MQTFVSPAVYIFCLREYDFETMLMIALMIDSIFEVDGTYLDRTCLLYNQCKHSTCSLHQTSFSVCRVVCT